MKKEYFFEIGSMPKLIGKVEIFFDDILEDLHLSEDVKNSILISVTEAVNNAIIHGNKKDPEKKVKIHCLLSNDILEIHIKDEGRGFSLEAVPNPLLPQNLTKDSGRGIFIIRSLLQSFDVHILPDGAEVVLKLNLSQAKTDQLC
jgi:serine/threonine-protein kinase RsbW